MKNLLLAALLVVSCWTFAGAAHPNSFLNQNEIEAIKAKVSAGQQPWASAYSSMLSKANSALSQAPLSVTFTGSSSHDYYVMRPYDWSNNMPSPCGATSCDGYINPKADREDYTTVTKFGGAIRDLGLGYAFTGQAKYADKAISLIKVFCLDAATYMTPKLGPNGIEHFITFPGLFYGADLIYNYPGWNASEKSAFLKWCTDFGNNVLPKHYSNNWEDWRQVFMASCGALTDNSTFKNNAFNNFKADLSSHIGSSGQMSKELGRTKSLSYSTYALVAMTEVAELARHQGVDLYGYTVSGRNLELAWDYHVPYVLNPSSWPREQISTYKGENCALYEVANMIKPKSTYQQVMAKYSMWESRVMGYTNFTHHYGLDVTPVCATPEILPNGGTYAGSVEITVTCVTTGADIYYTTNGSTPTTGSAKYSSPIMLLNTGTIKAKAFKSGIDPSSVASASFTIQVDNTPPAIASIMAAGNPNQVQVLFSEALDAAVAKAAGNYSISGGISVSGAAVSTDRKTITLATSTMAEGAGYTLTVSTAKDPSGNTATGLTRAFTYLAGWREDFNDGVADGWKASGGTWTIENGEYLNPLSNKNESYGGDPGWTDITYSADITAVSGVNVADVWMLFRVQDDNNYYLFTLVGTGGSGELYKLVNGNYTSVKSSGVVFNQGTTYSLKVVLNGSNIKIYNGATLILDVNDTQFSSGMVGFGGNKTEGKFDNVVVVTSGGQTILQAPVIPAGLDLKLLETGIYSLTGRLVQQPERAGVYLRVLETGNIKIVERFVVLGR